jgi:hypothetical protein
MGAPPEWLSHFANAVTGNILSHDVLPPLGCHFSYSKNIWEVTVFASRTEIVGGPEDGHSTDARLYVDVKQVLDLFSQIEQISWQTQPLGPYDELGSHLSIAGTHDGYPVWLRITAVAPERFEAGRRAIVNKREFEEVW